MQDSVTSVVVRGSDIYAGSVDGSLRRYDLRMGRVYTDQLSTPITGIAVTQVCVCGGGARVRGAGLRFRGSGVQAGRWFRVQAEASAEVQGFRRTGRAVVQGFRGTGRAVVRGSGGASGVQAHRQGSGSGVQGYRQGGGLGVQGNWQA